MKKIIMMFVLILALVLTGCSSQDSSPEISIDFQVVCGDEVIVDETFSVTEDNVADVTESILTELGIKYEYSSFGDFTYISSIYGIKEGSQGQYSGWCFTVNGETIYEGAGFCKVEEGDSIEWFFVTGDQY